VKLRAAARVNEMEIEPVIKLAIKTKLVKLRKSVRVTEIEIDPIIRKVQLPLDTPVVSPRESFKKVELIKLRPTIRVIDI
jgi:hypothetical protein